MNTYLHESTILQLRNWTTKSHDGEISIFRVSRPKEIALKVAHSMAQPNSSQNFLYYFSPFQDERMNRMLRQTMEPPRRKPVCELTCSSCLNYLCSRAMKAVLLADNHVELYSTDQPPKNSGLIGDDYTTSKCACQIKDVACLKCGNSVGYHVSQPCRRCMESCNNGNLSLI